MNFKETIKDGYEKNEYIEVFRSRSTTNFENLLFDKVIGLAPGKKILDLGCGNGYPYDTYFIDKGFILTGVDFSERFIKQAQINNPKATYISSDIESYEFDDEYDVILALYSIMHIPRENQEQLFKKIFNSLKPNGLFLFTTSNKLAEEIKQNNNFCGLDMLWSYYDYETYKKCCPKLVSNLFIQIMMLNMVVAKI